MQSQVKGIKMKILSANGSIVIPRLVFKLYFLAIKPSAKSEIPPIRIKTQRKLFKFISKKTIIGNINKILKLVIKLGMFLIEKSCFNVLVFNRSFVIYVFYIELIHYLNTRSL